jgi:hypothetical protein
VLEDLQAHDQIKLTDKLWEHIRYVLDEDLVVGTLWSELEFGLRYIQADIMDPGRSFP